MKAFQPAFKVILPDEAEYGGFMKNTVEPAIGACLYEADEVTGDNKKIHYRIYDCENTVGTVMILHGFTEASDKFREMTWHFLNMGCKVCCVDLRDHGQSYRFGNDTGLTHVEHFKDYVSDVKQIYDNVFVPFSNGMPKYIFGHSMGGAVAAWMLSEYPGCFEKAVLSSPMIRPRTKGIPMPVAKLIAGISCVTGRKMSRLFFTRDYDRNSPFRTSHDTSEARYMYYRALQNKYEFLQNAYPSYGWLKESFKVDGFLLKRKNCRAVTADVLLCQAGSDRVVSNRYQNKYVKRLSKAHVCVFKNAGHEIYMSENGTMKEYLDTIAGFLKCQK